MTILAPFLFLLVLADVVRPRADRLVTRALLAISAAVVILGRG